MKELKIRMRGAVSQNYGWWKETKLCLAGGNSNNGANCALGYVNSNNAFSNSNANRVARNVTISWLRAVSFQNHDLTGKRWSSYYVTMSEHIKAERFHKQNLRIISETSGVSRFILESSGRIKCKPEEGIN